MAKKTQIVISSTWKTQTIVGGALLGACAGLLAAYLLTRRATREGREVAVTPAEGVQIGMLVFGLLKSIAGLGDRR